MLIGLRVMLAAAEKGQYAVIAPDFTDFSVVQLLIEQAERLRAPLLLSFSPGLKYDMTPRQYARFIRLVREEAQIASVPLGLHLDHAFTLADIREAIDIGFTSVMIDASREMWEVNIERTCEVVQMAHAAGVSVESELGHVAVGSQYDAQEDQNDQHGWLTEPDQAVEFVKQTGVDALAVAVGTIHGAYNGEPILDFKRLETIHRLVHVPLVLHGASGTGPENLRKAVQLGIRKINVFSELVQTLRSELLTGLQTDSSFHTMAHKRKAVRQVMDLYLEASGSVGVVKDQSVGLVSRVNDLFSNGYACSESVFLAFAERGGFASDIALQSLSMFLGGLCLKGETCGALTGALAVIGAVQSSINPVDKVRRETAFTTGKACMDWFQQEMGTTCCRTLTGINLNNPVEVQRYKDQQIGPQVCIPALEKTTRWLIDNLEGFKDE
jgi:ketose-bisphosphate aldolase/C_GCAxxG_C_C family probable redox protein